MPDFREMAEKAKKAHETHVAEQTRKDQIAAEERRRIVGNAVAALQADVLPLLTRAKAEFAAEGVEARIISDLEGRTHPSVIFQCLGPRRRSDGWQFEAPGAFFSSDDGTSIKVGFGEHGFDRYPKHQLGKAAPGNAEQLVSSAVQKALEAYYKALEEHRRDGTLDS